MSEPKVSAAEAPPASSLATIWATFVSPRAAFESILTRPVWALALVLLVVLGVAAVGVGFAKVTPEAYQRMLEESGQELPADLEPERLMAFARWSAVIGAAVVSPLVYFVIGGLFLVVFRLLGSDFRFRHSLSVGVHGLLPMGVAALIGIVISLARETIDPLELQGGGLLMSNLGFLATDETSKAMRALLTSADLFSVWCIWLLATGYRVVARVSAGASWGAVLLIWGVGVLLKVTLASAF
jgi:hypothetical protein